MKITIVQGAYCPVPSFYGTNAEKVWLSLGEELAGMGHTVVHLSRRFPGLKNSEIRNRVNHIRLTSRDAPKSKLCYRALDLLYSMRALRAIPPDADVVVSGSLWLPILMRRANARRLYVHIARMPKGQMRLYKHAARLQAVSSVVARAIECEVPEALARISVVPPCLSNCPPELAEHEVIERRSKRILYLGRLHPEKGVHLLLEAFINLRSSEWELELVGGHLEKHGGGGDRYLGFLKRLAARGAGKVTFSGMIEQSLINDRFRSSALMVYPSVAETGESFGMAPLEAMSCGTPAIVSSLDCFKDYLVKDRNGFVFEHRSNPVGGLMRELQKVIASDSLRLAAAWAGYQTSREFTVDKVADRYLKDFENMLEEQRLVARMA